MGRIAYLNQRGNIWWFRRRHPVILLTKSQSSQRSEACDGATKKAQATGHLAISLQTSSKREARFLSAQVSADFERAWAVVEAKMNEDDFEAEMLDNIAMAMTAGFRRYIGALRSTAATGQDHRIREKAYRIIEADLRTALGIETAASQATPTEQQKNSSPYNGYEVTEESELVAIIAEMEVYEESSLLAHIGPDARTQDDYYAEHLIREFQIHTGAFRTTVTEYLEACERLGLDPLAVTPDFELALTEALKTARDVGLNRNTYEGVTDGHFARKIDTNQSKRLFSDFALEYLSLRCQGYEFRRADETPYAATGLGFEKSSLRNWQSSVRVFTEIVGDLPIGEYGKEEILDFNNLLQRLPANFGKSSKDKRSAREVIEQTELEEEQSIPKIIERFRKTGLPQNEIDDELAKVKRKRISSTTMKRHQTALSAIFRRALDLGAVSSNPFQGRTLTTSDIKRRQRTEQRILRIGWGDRINDLFGSEKFKAPLSDIGDPLFWAPLIAAFAGLRMEEILQLRLGDILTEDGIHHFAIQNELGTQFLKTENSVRKVPLHSALIDIGLLRLVALRQSQGMNRLFPNISRSKSKGTLSGTFSKNFAYYISSRGIKEDGLDFHALRTDFLTRLTRAGVPDHIRKGLMGHDQTDVTHANYFRAGETMLNLKGFVDRIDINYSGILPPFGYSEYRALGKFKIVK